MIFFMLFFFYVPVSLICVSTFVSSFFFFFFYMERTKILDLSFRDRWCECMGERIRLRVTVNPIVSLAVCWSKRILINRLIVIKFVRRGC